MWNTLYVAGRSGFTAVLINALMVSGEDFLTGSFDADGVYLFWVPENFSLPKLKATLGPGIVFKYRLRFFDNIDSFTMFSKKNYYNNKLTAAQEQMFRDLVA
ncbi:MAG TPA: hypothetical protein VGD65_09315 [Chryseosolibacter sp.]